MIFSQNHTDSAKKVLQTTKVEFAAYKKYIADLAMHAYKLFILARWNSQLNRLPNRRFFVGVHRHHSKHLDACDYISLLFTGGSAAAH
jgi:hypothetical protein